LRGQLPGGARDEVHDDEEEVQNEDVPEDGGDKHRRGVGGGYHGDHHEDHGHKDRSNPEGHGENHEDENLKQANVKLRLGGDMGKERGGMLSPSSLCWRPPS